MKNNLFHYLIGLLYQLRERVTPSQDSPVSSCCLTLQRTNQFLRTGWCKVSHRFATTGLEKINCLVNLLNRELYQYALTKSDLEEMAWIEPKYSKNKVDKAGKILKQCFINNIEDTESLEIVNNWRSSCAFPLNNIQIFLRDNTRNIDTNAVITQRLKRTPSIIKKLNREQSMSLTTMQDIGGCRVVLNDINKVYLLRNKLLSSKTKNEFKNEKDYITKPKDSGYRGIHLIYRYRGEKEEIYNKHYVEIQIRTEIQHAWATTVEIIGTFLQQSLKSGEGSEKWLSFFENISHLFALLESQNFTTINHEDTINIKDKVIELVTDLDVHKKLEAFSLSTYNINQKINKGKKSGYFLLFLDIDKSVVEVSYYSPMQLEQATQDYIKKEKEYKNNKKVDTVLVAAQSIKSLEIAYPNYFADSVMFLKKLNEVLDIN